MYENERVRFVRARSNLENLSHLIFATAQLDLIISDRFGKPVKPREWF